MLARLRGRLARLRGRLARLSTWPWSGGTLRGFATTLPLPVIVFLIQRGVIELLPKEGPLLSD